MSPAAHALDRRLFDLRVAYDALAADVISLESGGTYAVLAAGSLVSGSTIDRAQPALAQVAEVRRGLALVAQLINEVGEVRGTGPLDEERATELFAHINGPSVVVPDDPTRAPRSPLAIVPSPVAPHDLLTAMGRAVMPVHDLVNQVDRVWTEFVPRLERATAEAERLHQAASSFRSVRDARTELVPLATRVIHDPLGAADDLARIEATLVAAATALARRPELEAELDAAGKQVDELEDLVAEGRSALARTSIEITDPGTLLDPLDPDVVGGERGLRPWLTRLRGLVERGDIELTEKGFASWQAMAEKLLASARLVAEANARPTERRRELRNLLRAARVKAGASGQAEDPHMTELARQAEQSLAAPCRLALAEAHVARYVEELRRSPTPEQARNAGRETEMAP
jgi:hypothetical protein